MASGENIKNANVTQRRTRLVLTGINAFRINLLTSLGSNGVLGKGLFLNKSSPARPHREMGLPLMAFVREL